MKMPKNEIKEKGNLWNEIKNLGIKICNSENENSIRKFLDQLFQKLNKIEKRFGSDADTLATRGDYIRISSNYYSLYYYKKAYKVALRKRDLQNLVLVSSSVAEIYLEDFEDVKNGEIWLKNLEKALNNFSDVFEKSKLKRLKKLLMKIKLKQLPQKSQ